MDTKQNYKSQRQDPKVLSLGSLLLFYIITDHRFRLTTLPCPVMQLFEHLFELLWDRQAEVGGVLQDGEAVIRDRPEDDGSTQYPRLVQHIDVQHLGDPDKQEGQHLPAQAAEADRGAELLILDGTHHAGDVVHDHEDQQ